MSVDEWHLPGGWHDLVEDFNETAPYGQEHRRQVEVTFNLTEEQVKQFTPAIFGFSYEEAKWISDPKNHSQYRV